jgi:3',5'-cyclic AMP phosphodiesterase CpdA
VTFPLSLAVISDTHFGVTARAAEFRPDPVLAGALDRDFVQRFEELISVAEIRCDYLLMPGDIADVAASAEYEVASRVVPRLQKILGLDDAHTVIVPGNHDADWSVFKTHGSVEEYVLAERYAPLRFGSWPFERLMTNATGHVCTSPYLGMWADARIVVAVLNSAAHDRPEAQPHHGMVTPEQVAALDFALRDVPPDERFRLALLHHHPIAYSDPIATEPDFSQMVNAPALLSTLRKHRLDFVLHGHKHSPRFQISIDSTGWPLPILCAGSFSAILDPRWSGKVLNQFHVIRVEDRDSDGHVRGRVTSWAYITGTGWVPSGPHAGLEHEIGFGTYTEPRRLATDIGREVDKLVASSGFAEWTKLLEAMPDLRYVPTEAISAALEAHAAARRLRVVGAIPALVVLGLDPVR